jgi:opacity protein-like surface antigen
MPSGVDAGVSIVYSDGLAKNRQGFRLICAASEVGIVNAGRRSGWRSRECPLSSGIDRPLVTEECDMRKLFGVALLVMAAAVPAAAQEYRPIGVNFGGGWVFPVAGCTGGDEERCFSDVFDAGWNASVGVTFNVAPTVGVQAEYMYGRMGGPDRTIPISNLPEGGTTQSGVIESNHQLHAVTFNAIFNTPLNTGQPVGAYVLGGGGYYHRMIQLTTPSVGYTTICDPYWLVCYPTLVSVDRIIGDRSSNDFGINFGGGITFGSDVKFYVEARYHYVWGSKVPEQTAQLPSGATVTSCAGGCSTNAGYMPLTFGVRW